MMQDRRAVLERAVRRIEQLEDQLREAQQAAHREPIAIVGMACRFPGGIASVDDYWNLLAAGRAAVGEVPKGRWDGEALVSSDPATPGTMVTSRGGFLDRVDEFDAAFFGMSPREADQTDPQHRLALEVAWEALEDAAWANEAARSANVGVFLGITTHDYAQMVAARRERVDGYYLTGNSSNFAAGRISHAFGFHGPSIAVDTACSSSLVAVHLACQALQQGDCEWALAGGVNLMLSPVSSIAASNLRMLSASGAIRPFDRRADGILRAEGCGFVLLKRRSSALADGDRVRALVVGSALGHNGRGAGITVPNATAQERMIREALRRAGVTGADVGYVEAHGTGTPLGDPIELDALQRVFVHGQTRGEALAVGSVKANLGHMESAAGIAGLIKAALVLERAAIPPQPALEQLTEAVNWHEVEHGLCISRELRAWNEPRVERHAGVSALGGSGTNAHVVLKQSPPVSRPPDDEASTPKLLALSALEPGPLRALAAQYHAKLAGAGAAEPSLADVCFTSQVGRHHFAHRLALTGTERSHFVEGLEAFLDGKSHPRIVRGARPTGTTPRVVFLYTGQGAVHLGMARALYEASPPFAAQIRACERALESIGQPAALRAIFEAPSDSPSETKAAIEPRVGQLALFALQVALTEYLKSLGVEPRTVIGHSLGEYAAAVTAGVFSLETALTLVSERARLVDVWSTEGGMASVAAREPEVRDLLRDEARFVSVAAVNGERHVVISGERAALDRVLARLRSHSIAAKTLGTSHAFHSPAMDAVVPHFAACADGREYHAPRLQFLACAGGTAGGENGQARFDASYWVRHLREPVLFSRALDRLDPAEPKVCVEIGPSPTLVPFARAHLGRAAGAWATTLAPVRDDRESMVSALAELYAAGVDVRWSRLHDERGASARKRTALPTYPFQRQSHWFGAAGADAQTVADACGPARPRGEYPLWTECLDTPNGPVFAGAFSFARLPLLGDHRIRGQIVVPGALWLEFALHAALRAFEPRSVTLRDVTFLAPMVLSDDATRPVQLRLARESERAAEASASFTIHSRASDASGWTCHATGRVEWSFTPAGDSPAPGMREGLTRWEGLSARLRAHGIELGPRFEWLRELQRGTRFARAALRPAGREDEAGAYVFHPGALDSCLQLIAATLDADAAGDDARVPFHVERLTLHRPGVPAHAVEARLRSADAAADAMEADVRLEDSQGACVAEICGVSLRRIPRESLRRDPRQAGLLFELQWEAFPWASAPEPPSASGLWWLLGANEELARPLEEAIARRGGRSVRVTGELPNEAPAGVILLHALGLAPGDDDRDVGREGQVVTEAVLRSVQELLRTSVELRGRLWLLTRGAHAVGDVPSAVSPAQACVWGLGRVLASEHPELKVCQIDLDPSLPHGATDAWCDVLVSGIEEDQIAIRGGSWHRARLVAASTIPRAPSIPAQARWTSHERGDLAAMVLEPGTRPEPGPEHVVIETRAAGLNFRDVLNGLGMYPEPGPFGGEGAGRVVAVGADVTDVRVGEDVMALFPEGGGLARFITVRSQFVARKPSHLTLLEAAGTPVAFLTARYALEQAAQLKPGERVLIHAAAGGVGLAAIQIAVRMGAEVFATASPEKWPYLRSIGVRHLASSRSLEFARQLDAGDGVDVVLNSLTGSFIDASFALLRPRGRFVELGKRDLASAQRMLQERPDVLFARVDLLEVAGREPQTIAAMLRALVRDLEDGALRPLPTQSFPFEEAPAALQHMAKARHVGKVVVTCPGSAPEAEWSARSNASYLVTGGLGALGQLTAEWLARRGARDLVLLGRHAVHAVSDAGGGIEAKLAALGARVHRVQADVADPRAMADVMARLERDLPPIRGIVHAAATLHDAPLHQQDPARMAELLEAKVRGAWNLHALTRERALDFFVCYGSAAWLLGNPSQGPYAAGNGFLTALARYRRSRGLKATVVDWGPWKQEGHGLNAGDSSRWLALGLLPLTPEEGLDALGHLLQVDAGHAAVVSMNRRVFLERTQGLRSQALLLESLRDPKRDSKEPAPVDFLSRLRASPPALWRQLIEQQVEDQLRTVLGQRQGAPVDRNLGFFEQGLDSLLGLELRNRLQTSLACRITPNTVIDYPTVSVLSAFLYRLVAEREGREGTCPVSPPEGQRHPDRAAVEARGFEREPHEGDTGRLLSLLDDQIALLTQLSGESEDSSHG